ncbi:MAG: hypothetical protein GY703_01490 [Gammaproteobacteria bacterium]|nr:hypothetical protein [Gammaproteobacteria bacterium]
MLFRAGLLTSDYRLPLLTASAQGIDELLYAPDEFVVSVYSFLPDGILDTSVAPTQYGERRLAGVDLQNPRMRAVSEALLVLSPKPDGFTLAELATKVRERLPDSQLNHAPPPCQL